jgi:parvulin-like peptidyl-prolyl isomerase
LGLLSRLKPEGRPRGTRVKKAVLPAILAAVCFILLSCNKEKNGGTASRSDSQSLPVLDIHGKKILQKDFEAYLERALSAFTLPSDQENPDKGGNELKSRLFDQFMEEELLYQEAVRQGISVPDERIDEYLKNMHMAPMDEKESSQMFADQEFRNRIRRNLIIKDFADKVVLGNLEVTEEEVRDYYDKHPAEFTTGDEYRFKWLRTRNEETANKIMNELSHAATTFESLADEYSGAEDTEIWGDLGYWSKDDLPAMVSNSLSTARNGTLHGPVKDPYDWYNIFLLVDQKRGRTASYSEVRDTLLPRVRREKGEQILRKYVEDLKNDEGVTANYTNLGFSYMPRAGF